MNKIILNKVYKTSELIFIGLLIPTLILVYRLAENVILILWLITLYGGFIYLKYHNRSNLKQIMNFQAFTKKKCKYNSGEMAIAYNCDILDNFLFLQ